MKKIKCANNSAVQSKKLRKIKKYTPVYIMFLPVLIYYILFCYKPMYGLLMVFKDFDIAQGIFGSRWVGLLHFDRFINNYYFWRLLKNTLTISLTSLVFGFPAPIILALLLNEVRHKKFKTVVQNITYLPHFISTIVICGMLKDFLGETGWINDLIVFFGGERKMLLNDPELFVPIYVISGIWQAVGWNSIIYMAALSNVPMELYEAAEIDGAGRWKQLWVVTIPAILPTIVTLFILRMGSVLSVGYEKIILLYSPLTYKTADVISTYTYREGLLGANWSYSAAVGVFNSVINFVLLIVFNRISKKVSDTSLW